MRKNIFLLSLAFFLGLNYLTAQESNEGKFSAELNCDLFVVDELSITPTFIKLRYFVNDEIAVRLTSWFHFNSEQRVPESTLNYSYFATRPGVEYHLASEPGTYTAYVGLEVILDNAAHSFDTKVGVPVDGAWNINDIRNFQNRGYFSYGAVLLAGAELYRGSSFYFGTEFGFAFTRTNHSEVNYGNELFLGKAKSASFAIDMSRLLRVGFTINTK